jgi:hypothetical protein
MVGAAGFEGLRSMPTSRITAAVVARMTSGDTTWDSEVSGFGIPRKRDRLYLVKTRIHGK